MFVAFHVFSLLPLGISCLSEMLPTASTMLANHIATEKSHGNPSSQEVKSQKRNNSRPLNSHMLPPSPCTLMMVLADVHNRRRR
jgi:hypothetical protein